MNFHAKFARVNVCMGNLAFICSPPLAFGLANNYSIDVDTRTWARGDFCSLCLISLE